MNIAVFIITVFMLVSFWVWWVFIRNPHAPLKKLIMPGRYIVRLKRDAYELWVSHDWNSKGIKGIKRSRNKQEEIFVRRPGLDFLKVDSDRGSALQEPNGHNSMNEANVYLSQTGEYEISSVKSDPCVVIIVPSDAHYSNLKSLFDIYGIDEDEGFEPRNNNLDAH